MKRLDLIGSIRPTIGRTSQGGYRIPANLTRTGVFTYRNTDGSSIRELRHPDDVFAPESLATLRDAPVIVGHPDMVNPDNWRSLAVGNVHEATPDGIYVASELTIQDATAMRGVDSGAHRELSCGYDCTLVDGAGVYNGEAYDARQTNIRYNHVGMGPRNWGRAGNQVQLKLDGESVCYLDDMTVELLQKEIDALKAENARLTVAVSKADSARLDTITAEKDTAVAELTSLRVKYDAAVAAGSDEAMSAKVAARVALEATAVSLLSTPAKPFKADGLSDRDVQVLVVAKHDPTFKSDGKSDEYVSARFDGAKVALSAGATSLAAVNQVTKDPAEHVDSDDGAHAEYLRKQQAIWKRPGSN